MNKVKLIIEKLFFIIKTLIKGNNMTKLKAIIGIVMTLLCSGLYAAPLTTVQKASLQQELDTAKKNVDETIKKLQNGTVEDKFASAKLIKEQRLKIYNIKHKLSEK